MAPDSILKVPYFKQDKGNTCGPASLQMVLAYKGKRTSEDKLVRLMDTNENGSTHRSLVESVRKHGFRCREKSESSVEDLRTAIDEDNPPIVNFIEPSHDDGHYAVVVGFRGDEIILNDPWNGEEFKMPVKEFENRWHNSDGRSKRWFLIVE